MNDDEYNQVMKYLEYAAGTQMFEFWLKIKWRLAAES